MAFAPLVLGAAGTAVSALGIYQQGQARAASANYQAQVAANNAIIAGQNADYAVNAGQAKAAAQSLKGAAIGGRIKASQAANNVDVNTGSAVDVQQSQREISKLDTETTLNNAQLQAYGYRANQTNYLAQSELDKQEAESDKTGAALGAAGSLLSNASSLGFKWAGMNG